MNGSMLNALITDGSVQAAARRLYDAETALHAARQSHVDAWIVAAGDRLHHAVTAYLAAAAAPTINTL
jgi:hypothetical protein